MTKLSPATSLLLALVVLLGCSSGELPLPEETETSGHSDDANTDTEDAPDFTWALDEEIESLITVSWDQPTDATGYVEYSFDEGEWHQSPERALSMGPQEQLLLGVPYETDVAIHLVVDGVDSETLIAETGELPARLPLPEYVSGDPDQWYREGNYVYTSISEDEDGWGGDNFWKLILDRQGRVVWALMTPADQWTLWTQLSRDGRYLMYDEITLYDWGSDDPSLIHKMTIDGTIVETTEAEGLHHAWDELADGSLVWGAYITGNEEWLQKRGPDGTVETLWKCSEFEVEQLGSTATSCHSNSWWWHEESDTFLVSFPSSAGAVRDTVLHLDAEGNTLDTWGQLSDWSFAEEANTFDYQHGVTFTEDGTLLLSTQLTSANDYYQRSYDTLAVREYELDYDNQIIRQVWAFGEDQEIAGNYGGEAHRLANGNTLHNFGTGARMREITADGELVWDVKFDGGNSEGRGRLQGRSVFIEDLYDLAP